jgi:tRNA C32,U32 (ribose-2'-O)-methylase TrmJ
MALNNISVVLVGPRHAGNVGLVARAMKNTGLSHLVVVKSSKHQSKKADIFGAPARDIEGHDL